MAHLIESSILRILTSDGKTAGTGFLVAHKLAVTCAHVITMVESDSYGQTIQVQFANREEKISASVKWWKEPTKEDVAFLELDFVPDGIQPLRLASARASHPGHPIYSFGYARAAGVKGIYATGTVDGYQAEENLLQFQLRFKSPQTDKGMSGAPVYDEKRRVVVGMIRRGPDEKKGEHDKNKNTTFAIPVDTLFKVYPEDASPEIKPSEICPYIGLESFTDKNTEFFFGRKDLTETLVDKLANGCRFLALIGLSGSGKSSVIQAGLTPALRQGEVLGSEKWQIVSIRPGSNPFEQLASFGFISNPQIGLDICLKTWLTEHSDKTHLLLFIDQFEELFARCADELQTRFLRELADALKNPQFLLVISMRSDFLGAFEQKAALIADAQQPELVRVPANLNRTELKEIIESPAELVGLKLESGLGDLIIKDLSANGGVNSDKLPLLEFALTELWEKRRDGFLTLDAYQEINGVTGSLVKWAQTAYESLMQSEQILADRLLFLLIRLVRLVPPDKGDWVVIRERRSINDFDSETRRVIEYFADKRLLVSGESVEFIHDVLLREWKKLQELAQENREHKLIQQDVKDAASIWEPFPQNTDLLVHRGKRLEDALKWQDKFQKPESDYIDACQQAVRRQKKIVQASVSFVVVALIVILGAWAWSGAESIKQLGYQAATAEAAKSTAETNELIANMAGNEAKQQAEIALARRLAVQAQSIFSSDDFEQQEIALLLAIQSTKMFPESDVTQILQNHTLARRIVSMNHSGYQLQSIAFSPNGEYIVAIAGDTTICVWESTTGNKIACIDHQSGVNSIVFSPDSKKVVSSSTVGTILIWETATGNIIARLSHSSVKSVAFDPDGTNVVSLSGDTACVWESNTGKKNSCMPHTFVGAFVSFSADGKYAASRIDNNERVVLVWKTSIQDEFMHLSHISAESITYHSDGGYTINLFNGSSSIIYILEAAQGNEIARMPVFNRTNLSPDGKYVVSIPDASSSITIFEVETGNEIARVFSDDWISSVAFSPDGRYVVLGSNDKTARAWEIHTGKEMARMTHGGQVNSVAFSPDGRYVVSGSDDKTARIWEAFTGKEVARMVSNRSVENVAFSPDGRNVVLGEGISLGIWDAIIELDTGKSLNDDLMSFSLDGRYAVSVSRDTGILVLDVTTKQILAQIKRDDDNLWFITFSPDGQYIAISSIADSTIQVWETYTGKKVAEIHHDDLLMFIAFSPDSKYLLLSNLNRDTFTQEIQIWQVSTGEVVARMLHDSVVKSATFSPDGLYIASGSSDKTARVWEAYTGKEVARITHGEDVNSVAFSPDGLYVVSASDDNTAQVWDAYTGKQVAQVTHDKPISSVAFSPDGQYVASVSEDYMVHIWDIHTRNEITRIVNSSRVT
jgi:WD40 repeat protein/V8-like Glu-specific endopeptidase